jgi:hypothetical protein
MDKWIACAAVAALLLPFTIAHAVSCNPKAQVHQQRLAAIQTAVSFGQIPSADDEQFVLCMLPEKEDQQAFKQQVQKTRNQQQARQQQEAEQKRQAIIAHNRPQSHEEQARAQAHCTSLVREGGELRNAGVAYCLAAWKANPHSSCGGDNLPCGGEMNAPCYAPYAGQRCINGRVTGGGAFNVSPWFDNAPVQITKLADGIYTDEGMPCGKPGERGVILIQGATAQMWGRNTYKLLNSKQAGVLDALNSGTGDQGYNGQIIVSGSTFRWSGYGVDAQRPFRLCQANQLDSGSTVASQGGQSNQVSPRVQQQQLGGTAEQENCKVFPFGADMTITTPYAGGCKNGLAQGQGGYSYTVKDFPNLVTLIKGEFNEGKLNGRAVQDRPGMHFEGEFVENRVVRSTVNGREMKIRTP